MAEVAMRNMAPSSVDLVLEDIFEPEGAAGAGEPPSVLSGDRCDMALLAHVAG
jgi:hypothetical protein